MRKLMRLDIILPVICVAIIVTCAYGQPPGRPNPYAITSPTGLEQIEADNGGPFNSYVNLTQARDAAGYEKIVPATGQTLAVPNQISIVQMTPAGGLSALTFTTPTSPADGNRLLFFSTQAITTFNLTAASGSGQTVNGNLAGSLSANTAIEYLYSISNKTWDRIQ
jgi:hypothetical protein